MPDDTQRRQQIRTILIKLLNAAYTEADLSTLVAERFDDAYADFQGGHGKLDKIVLLIDHCASHEGQIDALLQQVKRRRPRQYDRFAARLAPLLPWPEPPAEALAEAVPAGAGLIQLQLALRERDNLQPPANTRVYAWLSVDDEDFDIIGDDVQPVPWTHAGPDPVTFHLRPRRVGHYQSVRIELYHESNYLGAVERDIKARSASEPGGPQPIRATVALYPDLTPPDLLIRFYRGDVRDGKVRYHYRVSSPLSELELDPLAHMGSIALGETKTVLRSVLEDLDVWAKLETPEKANLDARLASLGAHLYARLVGDTKLAELYWSLPRRCRTIQIISDVPGIPWEMIRPTDSASGVAEAWARQFHLTRWHPEAGAAPPGFGLDGIKVFVGQFTPQLEGAEPEAQALEALLGSRCERVQPGQLRDVLSAGGFGALHIISHGYAESDNADESYVRVGGGEPNLAASDLAGCNWEASRPLLFVNACNVGREGIGLGGSGGWATVALTQQPQAGAFVGALWQATDGTAGIFSETFYRSLLNGATVGAAATDARLAIESRPDPTWLCYAVYAHPNARVL